jgi:hypothetical protein
VQGAVFDYTVSAAAISAIPITNRGEYLIAPSVGFRAGDPSAIAHAVVRLQRKRITISAFAGTSYSVGDVLTFVGGTYDSPVKVKVDSVSGGGAIETFHVIAGGRYSVVPDNNVQVTGGDGSGARFEVTWCLGVILVLDGGLYANTPIAILFGDSVTEGSLGAVIMGPRQLVGKIDGNLTKPFDPVTTVKDTIEFPIYAPAPPVGSGPSTQFVRACTQSLPPYSYTGSGNHILIGLGLYGGPGPLPPIDGRQLNAGLFTGDLILLDDGSIYAGIWRVVYPGSDNGGDPIPWVLQRHTGIVQPNVGDRVNVTDGAANAGLWECTGESDLATVAGNFDKINEAAENAALNAPQYKVTIDYQAIELNFEYVAEDFASEPRFLRDEYLRDGDGKIVIDPVTGKTMAMKIDSVSAISQVLDANGQILDGPATIIAEATWRAAVKYIGTAAQFEQTPAGAYWHVKETATIKLAPIVVSGSIIVAEAVIS